MTWKHLTTIPSEPFKLPKAAEKLRSELNDELDDVLSARRACEDEQRRVASLGLPQPFAEMPTDPDRVALREKIEACESRELALRTRLRDEWYPLRRRLRTEFATEAGARLAAARESAQTKLIALLDIGEPEGTVPVANPPEVLNMIINWLPGIRSLRARTLENANRANQREDEQENTQAIAHLTGKLRMPAGAR